MTEEINIISDSRKLLGKTFKVVKEEGDVGIYEEVEEDNNELEK